MPRLVYMVTKQMMCLKQTQSQLYFATVQRWKCLEHWINIQISSSVVKWYTSSHEKGLWNSLKQSSRGVQQKRCSWKFSQNPQENTCTGGPFLLKLQAWATYLKKDSGTSIFLWILWNFQEHLLSLNYSGRLFLNSLFRRFSKVMVKIREEYQRKFILFSYLVS